VKHNHPDMSVRRQCVLLSLARSALYDQPRGESAETLRFMEIIHCPAGASEGCCREGTSVLRTWKRRGMGHGKWPATCNEKATNVGDVALKARPSRDGYGG